MTTTRDRTASENMGLVHSIAQRFKGRGIEYDDLVGAGCVGLVKAIDRFDENRGLCFSTYAVPLIMGEIKGLFRQSGAVRVSRSLKDIALKASRYTEEYVKRTGQEPSVSEIAQGIGQTQNIQQRRYALADSRCRLRYQTKQTMIHSLIYPQSRRRNGCQRNLAYIRNCQHCQAMTGK